MPEDLAQAFATLHLAPTAPLGAADAVFKFWARHCHPDVGGDPAQFRAANDAIQIIRRYLDPQERPMTTDQSPSNAKAAGLMGCQQASTPGARRTGRNCCLFHFVLDASPSMHPYRADLIRAYNMYLCSGSRVRRIP